MLTVTNILFMIIAAFAAGVVQTTTGFGSGIVMMIFLANAFPLANASAISCTIGMAAQIALIITYYKSINIRHLFMPLPIYMLMSYIGIQIAAGKNLKGYKVFFGVFLILLAIYFIAFQKRIKIKGTPLSSQICGGLSGIVGGMFGIGGPPMAIYYLAISGADKAMYIGTLQMFFFLSSIYNTSVRIFKGVLTLEHLPFVIIGLISIVVGKQVGTLILNRINIETMKKLVYAFTAIAGIINILQNI